MYTDLGQMYQYLKFKFSIQLVLILLTAFFLPGALSASSMTACFKQLLHVITVLFLYLNQLWYSPF